MPLGLAKPQTTTPAPAGKPATAAAAPAVNNKPVLDAIAALKAELLAKIEEQSGKLVSVENLLKKIGTAPAAAPAKATAPAKQSTPAPTAQQSAPAQTATVPTGDLDSMSRAQLIEVAKKLNIPTGGVKAADLLAKIKEAQAASGGEEATDASTSEKVTILMKLIEDNIEVLGPMLEGPPDLENGKLGCGGDCVRCPNPEGHATVEQQINACFEGVHASLGQPVPEV